MKKKMFAVMAIVLGLVCGVGGYVAFQNTRQASADNEKIAKEMETIRDVVVKEGESLPQPEDAFAETTMIDKGSIKADIKQVDVTVPGTYEVEYTFQDVKGQQRSKTVSYTVEAKLSEHVSGMDDIQVNYADELPEMNVMYDEYVESVVRDDSAVDTEMPGVYPITYNILGKDGNLETVERNVTVFDTRPSPTPTPTPSPTPKPEKEMKELEEIENNDGTEEAGTADGEEPVETGNVEMTQKDHTVLTGDDTNFAPIIAMICIAAVAFGVAFVMLKKRKK